jgi:hypothetical protein
VITGNGVVLGLVVLMAVLVGVVIGALAVRSGHWYGRQPEPPKPPGRHASRRPDGAPERRRDYLQPDDHGREEPVTGPRTPSGSGSANLGPEAVTEQLRAATGPLVVGRTWRDDMEQPETREMTAPRPSPDQDMARWRSGQRERDDLAEQRPEDSGWPH